MAPETVIRALNGEPVSDDVRIRVAAAVVHLGQPDEPVGPSRQVEVLSADDDASGSPQEPVPPIAEPTDQPWFDVATDVGSVALDAQASEVERVDMHLKQLEALFAEVLRRLRAGRRERVEDLELLSELLIEGWRGVDRRLGRIEKILARLEQASSQTETDATGAVTRLEDWVQQPRSH